MTTPGKTSTAPATMETVFIGRQPILDRAGHLYAYELLHRNRAEALSAQGDGDSMSSDMLLNAVLEVGVRRICGGHRAFINVTRNLLLNGSIDSLPPEGVMLEVLETVTVDDQLLECIRELRDKRFEIALDDYECRPDRDALLAYADVVKLDVLALDRDSLQRHVERLKRLDLLLLAEKVETPEMHRELLRMGFDLFQGYFFARPEVYAAQRLLPNRLTILRLLASVNDPAITPESLSNIIRSDVSLSITVLRWANSPTLGLLQSVESVERAIIVLGLQTLRNWVSLVALSRLDGLPSQLSTTVLVRARTCELLAAAAGRAAASDYFLVGLLSTLDIILQTAMPLALEQVALAPHQKAALLSRAGDAGAVLDAVIDLEEGRKPACLGLSAQSIVGCHLDALQWTDALNRINA
jgi:EAL and modified HD-GYP domain-containing signal transduction protein